MATILLLLQIHEILTSLFWFESSADKTRNDTFSRKENALDKKEFVFNKKLIAGNKTYFSNLSSQKMKKRIFT